MLKVPYHPKLLIPRPPRPAPPPHPLECHAFNPPYNSRHLSPVKVSKPPQSSISQLICDRRNSQLHPEALVWYLAQVVAPQVHLNILNSATSKFISWGSLSSTLRPIQHSWFNGYPVEFALQF